MANSDHTVTAHLTTLFNELEPIITESLKPYVSTKVSSVFSPQAQSPQPANHPLRDPKLIEALLQVHAQRQKRLTQNNVLEDQRFTSSLPPTIEPELKHTSYFRKAPPHTSPIYRDK